MSALAPRDRERLIGVLELLASPAAGERDAAAHAAVRLLRTHGLRWGDVVQPPAASQPQRHTSADDDDLAAIGRWPGGARALASDCARNGRGVLTEWEVTFCQNCSTIRTLSRKQAAILRRLAERLTLEGRFT